MSSNLARLEKILIEHNKLKLTPPTKNKNIFLMAIEYSFSHVSNIR